MAPRIAVLLGAGASYGAGAIEPELPPLGNDLFERLQEAYPNTWGAVPENLTALFEADFETGMIELWNRADSQVQMAIIDMARYFALFRPPADASDSYSSLVRTLRDGGLLPALAVASLNYECLLELAAGGAGVPVTYAANGRPPGSLLMWKPHGSCNLVPPLEIYNSSFKNTANYYEGPLNALHPDEVLAKYSAGYSLPPAMSLYAPGKPTPVAAQFVDQARKEWGQWARSAQYVTVIGAAPNLADGHIWAPILEGSSAVWYVGGEERDFADFKEALGPRLTNLGRRISDALPGIERRLRLLA
jgi:hypothetical protein